MRRKYRTDENHSEIMTVFESFGFSVIDLSGAPSYSQRNIGVSDLLIGYNLINELVEAKFDKGKYSQSQIAFNKSWKGAPPRLVASINDAVDLAHSMRKKIKNGG